MLAYFFAFRDYDELPRVQVHKLDIERLYNDGNGLKRICCLHSEEPNISGSYIRQYASTIASFQHSAASLDSDCLRADTLQRVVAVVNVVVDVVELVVDRIPVVHYSDHLELVHQREAVRHHLLHQFCPIAVVVVVAVVVEHLAVEPMRLSLDLYRTYLLFVSVEDLPVPVPTATVRLVVDVMKLVVAKALVAAFVVV
jgi:hypothetical protein